MTDVVPFTFDGDELQVAQEGDRVLVVVRRVCEVLGVDANTQQKRLRNDPSVTTVKLTVVAEDGKQREMLCVDHRGFPLWLAKIHPSKVRPELRPKLVRYQREAAEVLAEHFIGPRAGLAPASGPRKRPLQASGPDPFLLAALELMTPDERVRKAIAVLPPLEQPTVEGYVETLARLTALLPGGGPALTGEKVAALAHLVSLAVDASSLQEYDYRAFADVLPWLLTETRRQERALGNVHVSTVEETIARFVARAQPHQRRGILRR